ncbi:hypothetical protein ACIU1J_13075 [Azospirillum doebereinerae]|uniref:hypothetical protein n=1 Tax=Azospirillum doebereinerae TaxID=92933 RepID=UPI001EE5B9ED|nr:hypothetical protein [Azospirillum doebereinerae]MCG5242041.1 hypothetical protein [Azospirillum doebereinerae]
MAATANGTTDFDALNYLAANPDLIRTFGLDLAAASRHYETLGRTEGRALSFDSLGYLAGNTDLLRAVGADTTAATQHYVRYGYAEGRATSFDALGYVSANADLIGAIGANQQSAKQHYVAFGFKEGRTTYFNAGGYLAANADIYAAVGADLDAARLHYIQHGFQEGRQFQVDDYAENTTTLGRLAVSNGRTTGMIERPYDVDWFRTSMVQGTTYTLSVRFATTGLHDFALVDGSGNTLASDRDKDGDGVYTVSYRPTVSGSYYAAVSGFDVGLYTLTASNDGATTTLPTTTPFGDLPDDPSTPGRLTVNGIVNGLIDRSGDKDWYAITLNAGVMYRFEAPSQDNLGIKVYSDGNTVLPHTNVDLFTGKNAIIVTPTTTATYYVEVSGGSSANLPYTLRSSVGDDYGSTPATAGQITVGTAISVVSNYAYDIDWLAATMTKGSTYQLNGTSNAMDPTVTLYDAQGFRVSTNDLAPFSSNISQEVTITTTGTYYWAFGARSVGAHNATIQETSRNPGFVDDYGNSFGTAGRLTMNATTQGALEYRKDTDYLSVSLEKGKSYSFVVDGPALGNTRFDIFSPGNNAAYLKPTRTENGKSFYDYTACATGNFVVSIDSSDYKLGSYSITTTDNGMVDEYANDATTAGRLAIGGSVNGRIDYYGIDEFQGDTDWIALSLDAGQSYSLSMRSESSNTRLSLLDALGHSYGASPYVNASGDYSLMITPVTSGTYYASVSRPDGERSSALNGYTLTAGLYGA